MEPLSLEDIRQRVAEKLKIRAVGQGIRPQDAEVIDNALGDVLAVLAQDNVVEWTVNTVPRYAAIPITLAVAAASADGVVAVNADMHKAEASGAQALIQKLVFARDDEERDEPQLYY